MPSILVTVKISKGFKIWTEMAKSFEDEMPAEGAKIIWAAANPDETEIYCMMDVPDPDFMKTFGERPDVRKTRGRWCRCLHNHGYNSDWRLLGGKNSDKLAVGHYSLLPKL